MIVVCGINLPIPLIEPCPATQSTCSLLNLPDCGQRCRSCVVTFADVRIISRIIIIILTNPQQLGLLSVAGVCL